MTMQPNWVKPKLKLTYQSKYKHTRGKIKIKNLEETITNLVETYPFEDCEPFHKPTK